MKRGDLLADRIVRFFRKTKAVLLGIAKYPIRATKNDDRFIGVFSDWFGSIVGFKQQTMFMMGWTLIAIVFPVVDPNMLHLMVFLTIYSGITQPVLALGNTKTAELMMTLLRNNVHQMEAMKKIIEHQNEMIQRQQCVLEEIKQVRELDSKIILEMAEDIEELVEVEKKGDE